MVKLCKENPEGQRSSCGHAPPIRRLQTGCGVWDPAIPNRLIRVRPVRRIPEVTPHQNPTSLRSPSRSLVHVRADSWRCSSKVCGCRRTFVGMSLCGSSGRIRLAVCLYEWRTGQVSPASRPESVAASSSSSSSSPSILFFMSLQLLLATHDSNTPATRVALTDAFTSTNQLHPTS